MALAYLLSPTFEIVNSAGKPATGGYIEVYVAGSRTKYYCASDFDGTLHPFRIPLDSLGSNIVLAEDTGAYDVYVYNRYGTLLMSRYNVKSGGGGTLAGTITSSDGSISVTPTSTGVDLRVDLEAPSILRATAQSLTGDGLFQFSELQRDGRGATVDVNGRVMLSEGWWHYDATVRLRWPGNPAESGTQSISLYTANGSDSMPFDLSYAHSDTVQINGEFKSATSGTQFILGVLGIPAGLTVELVDFGIHSILGEGAANGRYYAGNGIQINEADRIVSVDTEVVQEKLTAGQNIVIEGNVISALGTYTQEQADWAQTDSEAASYIKNKPDLSVYATQTDLTNGLATKQDVISDLATIRSGAAAGATAVQDPNYVHTDNNFTNADATKLSGIEAGAEANVQANWNESDSSSDSYIQNKPAIPSGSQLVPAATPSDAGEVLTVDQQGVPTWAPAQAPISAGNGIDITNNVVSAKVDGTTVTINGSGELEATATPQVQSDWTETDTTDPSYIQNKPVPKTLVAGSNITITEDSSTMTISADAAPQVQANWAETDTSDPSYIQNKPDLDAYATDAELTAGLATKQDVISDIADIRAGAQQGATAVQPSDLSSALDPYATKQELNTGLAGKQNTIDDLTQIRQGASLGSTALQPGALDPYALTADVNTALDGKQDTLTAGQNITITNNVISAAADPQVQANWSETDPSEVSYIQNKPDLSVYATNTALTNGLATKQDVISDLATIRSGASAGATAVQPGSLSTVATTGSYTDLTDKPTIPAQLSAGNGISITNNVVTAKVDGTSIDVNSSGELEVIGGSFTQEQADWAETDSSAVSYIENKPVPKTLVAGTNIVITEDYSTITVTATAEPQVNADWNASSGVAQILNKPTIPSGTQLVPAATSADADKVLTVNAQGTPAWASAQAPISAGTGIDITNNVVSVDTSVVATQTDLAGKEDVFDVGTGLEMDTSGSTPTLQVEAPVDIVAGTGIAIDNPDGNTMRITNTGFPISETDAVLCGTFRGDPMYTKTYTFTGTVGTSETNIGMTIDEKKGTNNVNRIWIDPSTSFIVYGSAGNNFLPLSWRLGSSRQGSVAVLGASTGSLSCRCVDTSSTPITLNITIRYTVSNS